MSPGKPLTHWSFNQKCNLTSDVFSESFIPDPRLARNKTYISEYSVNISWKWNRLEKEMATHFSILSWKSPWTEEPGGLQSMGLHDWACVHEGGGRWVGINTVVELKKKRKENKIGQKTGSCPKDLFSIPVFKRLGGVGEVVWVRGREKEHTYFQRKKTRVMCTICIFIFHIMNFYNS